MQIGDQMARGTPGSDPKGTGWGMRLERFLAEAKAILETVPSRLRAEDKVPLDPPILRSHVQFYLDEADDKLKVRVRYSDSSLRTGEVDLSGAVVGGGDSLTVNGVAVVDADLDDATPAAPAGSVNVKWQKDAASPASVSAYLDGATALGNNARVTVRKNTGADVGTRRRLNLIEGANITLTVADDAGSEEIDVTVAAAAGGGGISMGLAVALDMATGMV